ncbi:hypothetical protein [Cystobacter fuscus]|uniref:hypothetical protein n=1 Tax=Cystobacter fuscus TaxID=43 RepID=UPI0012DE1910|nr:hypothetical protein [Cystobacter fuscus]
MNIESAFDLLRQGRSLAASLAPSLPGRLAWVGVYPLDPAKPSAAAFLSRLGQSPTYDQPIFRVRVIEVSESLVREERWICEDDLHSRDDEVVVGENALMSKLARLGLSRDALEWPYKVDYPI